MLEQLTVFLVDFLQNFAGACNPDVRIFLEIENLQFGDGCIPAVDGAALLGEGVGKFRGPALLKTSNFFQVRTLLVRICQFLGMAQAIAEHALALVHLLDVAGIAAEEIVLQDEGGFASSGKRRAKWLRPCRSSVGPRLWFRVRAARPQIHRQ